MSSAAPNAAWHPALMPNYVANTPIHVDAKEPGKLSSPLPEDAAEEPEPTATPAPLKAIETSTESDEWFPEYAAGTPTLPNGEESRDTEDAPVESAGHIANGPDHTPDQHVPGVPVESSEDVVISSDAAPNQEEQVATEEPVNLPEEVANASDAPHDHDQEDHDQEDPDQEDPDQEEHEAMEETAKSFDDVTNGHDASQYQEEQETLEESQPTSTSAAKHMSTDSFARTVSHMPNWTDDGEDGEPEWSLPRAETDLFKFMPPIERTNSFPVVPPLKEEFEQDQIEPLPSNQAEDIMNEVEHESEHLDEEAASHTPNALHQDNFWGDDDAAEDFPTQGFLGGDSQVPEEETLDERYAEGVPLINHQEAENAPESAENDSRDLFAHDAGEDGDDFFSQIGGASSSDPQEPFPAPLERKSTMQVLDGLGATAPDPLSNTLEETLLEENEDELELQPVKEPEPEPVASAAFAGESVGHEGQNPQGDDLATKWSEVFAGDDDDDLLLDDSATEGDEKEAIDPSAFFGDDDEGFLEDTDDQAPVPQPSQGPVDLKTGPRVLPSAGANGRYLPPSAAQTPVNQPNSYFPSATPSLLQPQIPSPFIGTPPVANPYAIPSTSATPLPAVYGAPAVRPAPNKTQSFADKSKGGYSSPYDLPMEVVKPRKRQNMQQLPRGPATPTLAPGPPPPPARSASMYSQPPAAAPPMQRHSMPPPSTQGPAQLQRSGSSMSPPSSAHSNEAPSTAPKPPPKLKSNASFFEELPMSARVRPASRTTNKSQPSPAANQQSFPPSIPTPPQEPHMANPAIPGISRLVAPERASPYAPQQPGTGHMPGLPPAAVNLRYSPAPAQGPMPNGAIPPAAASRYSPAPPVQRAAAQGSATSVTPPAMLPHLPRTSSPLAHFEVSHDRPRPSPSQQEPSLPPNRSNSSLYDPRLHRMPSLPPTREVEEDETTQQPPLTAAQNFVAQENQLPFRSRQTPPPAPLNAHGQTTLPPPKRQISYGPPSTTGMPPQTAEFVPPVRSQTQSPGAMYGLRSPIKPVDPIIRPSSVNEAASPSIATMIQPAAPAVSSRPRGFSQNLHVIAPTDGSEQDPLQRWRGAPCFHWGVGGIVVTTFPKDVPRYGIHQALPSVVRSPGEVKIKHVKDIQPLEEQLAKFPGPLKGKSKKKETITWLSIGIEGLESSLPPIAFQTEVSHEYKRAAERVLLWKILRLLIEHDGVLDGNAAVDQAVRDVLSPATGRQNSVASPIFAAGNNISGLGGESAATQTQADSVDSGTIEQLKHSLLVGQREQAVWAAADKRLWGHALLIANTVSPDLYHKVSQEFIKKEVNFPGHNNESLAALYAVLSGNHDECIDELVPSHARAGLQLVTTSSSTGPTKGGLEGLDKWRETLTFILSNRSVGDVKALNALGNLLSGYGRAEAAHICFLFARNASVFGGLDDPQANFVLVGADHKRQAEQFAKETEALLLSEVYEYGLSLAGGSNIAIGAPHLAVYKLQHAMTLAEYGFRDKALQYCDVLVNAIAAQTKRSPYHHITLESAVEDLRKRLNEAPREESSSWIPKPSMNKMSDSLFSRFNKFVAGDDDGPGQGSPKAVDETGPFGRIPGGTPTISRPASAGNATGMDMFGGSPNGYPSGAPPAAGTLSPVLSRQSSRYAPQPGAAPSQYDPNSTYTPMGRSSMERTSGEYSRSSLSYETRPPSGDYQAGQTNGYMPTAPPQAYPDAGLGISHQSAYQPIPQSEGAYGQSSAPVTPGFTPYAPLSQTSSPYAPAGPVATSASPYAPVAPRTNSVSPYAPSMPVADSQPTPPAHEPVPSPGYQPTSYGYEPPPMSQPEVPVAQTTEPESSGGYEAPSYQPYGYEPPYQPDIETTNDDGDSGSEPKPKKKSFMDDDDDDHFPSMKSGKPDAEKSKEEKDRENAELFRKAAEEDAKRAEEEKANKGKKGWGFGGWFGGGGPKKESLEQKKPIRAKLGEKSSFYYDPDQKRWINKAGGTEDSAPKTATPPPPRTASRLGAGTPPPPSMGTPPTSSSPNMVRPTGPPLRSVSDMGGAMGPPSSGPPGAGGLAVPPSMTRSVSSTSAGGMGPPSGPPSRPATSMSNASSIDDLLGAAAPRKGGAKNKKKGGRYIDVMAK